MIGLGVGEGSLGALGPGLRVTVGEGCQLSLFMSQLRESASHLRQLQGAYDDLMEEHSKASQEWAEKQAHLENELSTALQDKVTPGRGVGHNFIHKIHHFAESWSDELTRQSLAVCCDRLSVVLPVNSVRCKVWVLEKLNNL